MAKKTGLGRGLDSLFVETGESEIFEPKTKLRLTEIQPRKNQPRKTFDNDSLSELAESIAANGLIQPIVVRASSGGYYEIIAGERRWRASKLAGLTEVPVVVLDADDRKSAELSLIENIQRENLNPMEEAMAYRTLLSDYGLTQEELSSRIGKSRPSITNTMRLLDLPNEVASLVAEGEISEGNARALLGLKDRTLLAELAKTVCEKDLTVRQTEELVRKMNQKRDEVVEEIPASVKDVDYIAELEKKIRRSIGRRVRILEGKRSKKLEIEYTDNDDLEKLLTTLCGEAIFED